MNFDPNMIRSMAEPIVLQLVNERAMYGYEIIKIVNERTKGAFEWKEGTLYPCLHRLEADKLIQSEWVINPGERKRKYYAITKKGITALESKTSEWKSFTKAIDAIFSYPELQPAP